MIRGIVFLGNPGKEYEKSRHNLAWMAALQLSFYSRLTWNKKFNGLYAGYAAEGEKLWFLKPTTFMNLCGGSAAAFIQFFKIAPGELLVVHDDLELDFASFCLKQGGGATGHNGLRSIVNSLSTADFFRLRLGISRPAAGSVSSYVLSRFSPDEESLLPAYLAKAAGFLEQCLAGGCRPGEKNYKLTRVY